MSCFSDFPCLQCPVPPISCGLFCLLGLTCPVELGCSLDSDILMDSDVLWDLDALGCHIVFAYMLGACSVSCLSTVL